MSLISFTPLSDGVTGVNAAATNTPLSTIYNDYNGNITDANIAAGAAITQSKVALALLNADVATVATSQTTTSSTFGDLATAGPSVTVTVGASGKVFVSMAVDTVNGTSDYSIVGLVISGANTVAVAQYLLNFGTNEVQFGTSFVLKGLTPGSTTFKMQYRNFNNSSTATFKNRILSVIPL